MSVYTQFLNRVEPKAGDEVTTHQGGIAIRAHDMDVLRRFLIMGAGGSFYEDPMRQMEKAVPTIHTLIKNNPQEVLKLAIEVSRGNLAQDRKPALLVLAMLSLPTVPLETRRLAGDYLSTVARTGYDLLTWVNFRLSLAPKSHNSLFRRSVNEWMMKHRDLPLQAVKYDNRDGWAMRDVLRLTRPGATVGSTEEALRWMAKPDTRTTGEWSERLFNGYAAIREKGITGEKAASIIAEYRLPREAVPGELLSDTSVWEALFDGMPAEATLRNLGKLSSLGILTSDRFEAVVDRVSKSNIHPYKVFLARVMYGSGHGIKGGLSWEVNYDILTSLDALFVDAFKNLTVNEEAKPLIALDISGSMGWQSGGPVSPMLAEAGLSMVMSKQYPLAKFVAFSSGRRRHGNISGLSDITVDSHSLSGAMASIFSTGLEFGGTDCSLPLKHVIDFPHEHESVVVMTDSETGSPHRAHVLLDQARTDQPNLRFAVIAFALNDLTLSRPNDLLSIDLVGTDASVPVLLDAFLSGRM